MAVPVEPADRVEALDVLRGAALFGVLTVNLVTIFRHSLFEEFLHGPEDAWARAVSFGLEFKAVTLFSLLFGIGLEAQRERIDGFDRYIVRRLVFLLVVGLVHLFLFWNGDILTLYALCGLVVAPLLRLPTRALLGLAILLFVLQIVPVPYAQPFGTAADLREHVEAADRAYRYGTFVQALKFRIAEVRPMGVLLVSIVPRTVGLFLLGACVWRWNLLRGDRRVLAAIAIVGITLGTYATMIRANWASIVLAFGYGGAIVLAARPLHVLAPLGRMSFTCYLAQSLVLSFVFYGWGLGQFAHWPRATIYLVAPLTWGIMMIWSKPWLDRFAYGPLEWLWRSLARSRLQPMRA